MTVRRSCQHDLHQMVPCSKPPIQLLLLKRLANCSISHPVVANRIFSPSRHLPLEARTQNPCFRVIRQIETLGLRALYNSLAQFLY